MHSGESVVIFVVVGAAVVACMRVIAANLVVLVLLVTQMKTYHVFSIKKIVHHIIQVSVKFVLMLIHDSSVFLPAHPRQVTPNFVLKTGGNTYEW